MKGLPRRRRRASVVGFVLLGCTFSSVATGTVHAATSPRIVQARTTSTFALASTSPSLVQQVTIGPGAWTVFAKAFAVDFTAGDADFVRCQLVRGTKQLDASTGWVDPNIPGQMITNVAKLSVASGATATVKQRCWHDNANTVGAYLDPAATLLAFRASSSTVNRLTRTTSSVSVTNSTETTVATIGVGAGTWLVGFKATAVSYATGSSGYNTVRCTLSDGSVVSRNVSGRTGYPRATTMLAFGASFAAPAATTFKVACRDTSSQTTLDPQAVLWARKVNDPLLGGGCGAVSSSDSAIDLAMNERQGISCSIGSGAGASLVGGAQVPPGKWVALGAEQDVRANGLEFIRCRASDVTHNRTMDPAATEWNEPPVVDITDFSSGTTYLGRVTTTEDTVIEFRCGQDSSSFGNATSYQASYVLLRP